jgi:hypothetical protein
VGLGETAHRTVLLVLLAMRAAQVDVVQALRTD